MNSPKAIQEKIESLVNQWQSELERYNEDQFIRKPADNSWSIGQVYVHLAGAAKYFQLKNVELCVTNKGEEIKGGKKIPGKISFLLGMFPPVKIKVPASPEYTPNQPAGKEEVTLMLNEVLALVKNAVPLVEKSSPSHKTLHPALGSLNAREWYELIPMHFKHHLRQKSRLDKFLGVQS
ncbi:MAG: DinB family protein [bacterium]